MRHATYSVEAVHMFAIERGERLIPSVLDFARERGIKAAYVSGIGAVEDPIIGAYLLDERRYKKVELEGHWELLSLAGNVAVDEEGEVIFHPHVSLANADGETRGGHLFRATCAITVEAVFVELKGVIRRRYADDVGLKLWRL